MTKEYQQGFMDGMIAAFKKLKGEEKKPYIDKEGLIKRYGGKIGNNKAYEILNAVRHCCGGGKLNTNQAVLLSELEYWENTVAPEFKERI